MSSLWAVANDGQLIVAETYRRQIGRRLPRAATLAVGPRPGIGNSPLPVHWAHRLFFRTGSVAIACRPRTEA